MKKVKEKFNFFGLSGKLNRIVDIGIWLIKIKKILLDKVVIDFGQILNLYIKFVFCVLSYGLAMTKQGVIESGFCFQNINVAGWKMHWNMERIEPNRPVMWLLQSMGDGFKYLPYA